MENTILTLLPLLIAFFGTAVTLRFLIPVLKSKKMGQKILDIGPRWHKGKEGTPTMGGISFMLFIPFSCAFALIWLFFSGKIPSNELLAVIITLIYAFAGGLVGIADDLKKLKRKKNEGLTAGEKYSLQLIAAVLYVILLTRLGLISTTVFIPILNKVFDLGFFWYPLAILFLTGFGNAVNLTDGLDGLCAGVSAVVALFFLAYSLYNVSLGITVTSAALFGGMLGFLVYNLNPARVFMGDTGSLFLGALISGISIISGAPIILFLVGTVYFLEAVSVIIQVLFFKLTGKRVFLMAPLHHHLEKKGLSERKIMLIFVLLTFISSVVAFMILR